MSYPFRQAEYRYTGRDDVIDMIVIHFTAAATLLGTVSWFENPASEASSHYILGRNGSIVQMVNEGDRAWHAGDSHWDGEKYCNRFSVGIEVVNWGNLKMTDGLYRCWPDNWKRIYSTQKYGHPTNSGDWWWAPYPEEQIQACIDLVKDIRTRYPSITEDRIVGHSDISPGRKMDPGPLFPMDRLRIESSPEPLTLPDEMYMEDDPVEEDYEEKNTNRSHELSWLERLLVRVRKTFKKSI